MNKICKHIMDGDFEEAYSIVKGDSRKEFTEKVLSLYNEGENRQVVWSLYAFMQHSIFEENVSWKHSFLADFLTLYPASFLGNDGVEIIAVDHVQQAIYLDEDNLEYWQQLLEFKDAPAVTFTKEQLDEIQDRIRDLKV